MGAALSAAPFSWEAPLGPRLRAAPTSCVVFRACKTAIPRGGCQVSPACHRPRIRALGGCAPGGGTSEGGPNTPSDLEPSPQLPESRPLGLWFVSGADSAAPPGDVGAERRQCLQGLGADSGNRAASLSAVLSQRGNPFRQTLSTTQTGLGGGPWEEGCKALGWGAGLRLGAVVTWFLI